MWYIYLKIIHSKSNVLNFKTINYTWINQISVMCWGRSKVSTEDKYWWHINLHFTDGPKDSVRLSPNVTIVELEAGDPVPRVTCVADCEPECHYRWTQLYRNTVRDKSYNADLDLGMASSAMVGIYLCEVHNDRLGDNNTANITFELRVKCEYHF